MLGADYDPFDIGPAARSRQLQLTHVHQRRIIINYNICHSNCRDIYVYKYNIYCYILDHDRRRHFDVSTTVDPKIYEKYDSSPILIGMIWQSVNVA